MQKALLSLLLVVGGLGLGGANVFAQSAYPNKPVRIIVPYAPGGPTDTLSRIYAVEVAKTLGQQVVVETRPGAGGTVGLAELARAAPDGYTIGLGTPSTNITAPYLQKDLSFNPETAFAPISFNYLLDIVLVTKKELPANTLKEFIAYGKANPDKMVFGTEGPGSTTFLLGEMLKMRTGVSYLHVPFKGQSQFIAEMMAGRVDFSLTSIPGPLAGYKDGKLKILAVGSPTRAPQLPEVPTTDEAGLPGFDLQTWGGFFAPAGTDRNAIQRLSQEFRKAAAQQDVQQKLLAYGMIAKASTPEELDARVKSSRVMWLDLIKKLGIKPE
jgi:tripartite-type tricarboxylate transporter receptor subunit TctC